MHEKKDSRSKLGALGIDRRLTGGVRGVQYSIIKKKVSHASWSSKSIAAFLLLVLHFSLGAENLDHTETTRDINQRFNVLEPATFEYATEQQKDRLKAIAEREFSLVHLPEYERELVEEALRMSGLETQSVCAVDMHVRGHLGAFLVKRAHDEKTLFEPDLGVMEMPPKNKKDAPEPQWRKVLGSYTAYPYPLGEARLIPKVIPVNLSSITVLESTDDKVKFRAAPSALLFEKMKPEEQILAAEHLGIDLTVDRKTRRVSRLSLYLVEGVNVYRGIRIADVRFDYEFAEDAHTNQHVLTSVSHFMKGRLYWLFRPIFKFTTTLTHRGCSGEPRPYSYLFEAIDSINALK